MVLGFNRAPVRLVSRVGTNSDGTDSSGKGGYNAGRGSRHTSNVRSECGCRGGLRGKEEEGTIMGLLHFPGQTAAQGAKAFLPSTGATSRGVSSTRPEITDAESAVSSAGQRCSCRHRLQGSLLVPRCGKAGAAWCPEHPARAHAPGRGAVTRRARVPKATDTVRVLIRFTLTCQGDVKRLKV